MYSSVARKLFRLDFLTYFQNDYSAASDSQCLATLFESAIVLLHELVHCVSFFVENAWAHRGEDVDPRFTYSSVLHELWREWELWFSKGKVVTDVEFEAKVDMGKGVFPSEVLVLAEWVIEPEGMGGGEVVVQGVGKGYRRADVIRLWSL